MIASSPRPERALAQPGIAQRGVEARGVHAAVPAHDALGGHADLLEHGVGGGAGGEDDVAGAVEGADGHGHGAGELGTPGAQVGVGGELGVVAAEQWQAERAGEQRAGHAGGAGGADVDRVEGAVGERLHGGGQAGDADAQAGVVGDVDLGDGREAAVDLGIGGDDLDLIAGDAARADLFDRAGDAVGGADAVGEDGHARGLALAAEGQAREL